MRLRDIPVGHIARSKNSIYIILVLDDIGVYLNSDRYGLHYDLNNFMDDYEDLGELKVEVEEVKQYKISVSVG